MKMIVRGYTHSSKDSADVDSYYHDDLLEFVDGLDYLVNILPNTPSTTKLLDASVFEKMPARALFINVGRGSAVDEKALEKALKEEKIAGAILDVFSEEPLPKEHPFWNAKNVIITPHCSSTTDPKAVAPQIIENYHLMRQGKTLNNLVDMKLGY